MPPSRVWRKGPGITSKNARTPPGPKIKPPPPPGRGRLPRVHFKNHFETALPFVCAQTLGHPGGPKSTLGRGGPPPNGEFYKKPFSNSHFFGVHSAPPLLSYPLGPNISNKLSTSAHTPRGPLLGVGAFSFFPQKLRTFFHPPTIPPTTFPIVANDSWEGHPGRLLEL